MGDESLKAIGKGQEKLRTATVEYFAIINQVCLFREKCQEY